MEISWKFAELDLWTPW